MSLNKDSISGICRKRRPRSKSGVSKDEAGCYLRFRGTVTYRKLGLWGSPEVAEEYEKVRRKWYAGLLTEEANAEGVTLAYLFEEFLKMAVKKYRKPEIYVFRLVIGVAIELFPEKKAADFSATNFRTVRKVLIERGSREVKPWARQYVNTIMKALRQIFTWGVSFDYVPPDVVAKIKSVPALREAEHEELDERTPVEEVAGEVVIRTLPFMPPVVADMVKLQRGACMRPGEVCRLRVGDLDRTGDIWRTQTKKHKTARYGISRFAAFGPAETAILRRRCAGKGADEYVFSPRDAMLERWEAKRAAQKSPMTPSQEQRGEEADAGKLLRFGECYISTSYYRAVKYAQEKARKAGVEIPEWFPYQLRHAAVTETSLAHGRETASLQAGHLSMKTTEVYEHKAEKIAVNLAEERVSGWWNEM